MVLHFCAVVYVCRGVNVVKPISNQPVDYGFNISNADSPTSAVLAMLKVCFYFSIGNLFLVLSCFAIISIKPKQNAHRWWQMGPHPTLWVQLRTRPGERACWHHLICRRQIIMTLLLFSWKQHRQINVGRLILQFLFIFEFLCEGVSKQCCNCSNFCGIASICSTTPAGCVSVCQHTFSWSRVQSTPAQSSRTSQSLNAFGLQQSWQ